MTKKIGQTKRRFVEDDLLATQIENEQKMSKREGIIKERKRIIKLFKFELDNRVTSYDTLEKLDKIKKGIK
jgi:hypothetical protein